MQKKIKKLKQNKEVTVYFEAENGFVRKEKWKLKNLSPIIKIPFLYKVRVAPPEIGDSIDLEVTPIGIFQLQRMTKTKAFYKLVDIAK